MNSESGRPNARGYVSGLAASGRYHFTSGEARAALGVSAAAAKLALNRLAKQRLIASPARGFYIILPPEYIALGCLPAEQFIPALMKHLNLSYYTALLSAAQYHGAAHQRTQQFQVFVARNRRADPLRSSARRLHGAQASRGWSVQPFSTPRGTLLVSTPEATALDLVGYARHAGGLNQVATVLSELAERIDPEKLAAVARTAPVPWAQRLGYLLEHFDFVAKVSALKEYVRAHAKQSTVLLPKTGQRRSHRNKGWKLYVNAQRPRRV